MVMILNYRGFNLVKERFLKFVAWVEVEGRVLESCFRDFGVNF